ncbi:MAG: glycosyltransferase family 4 protein [Capsulimonadales bacterium]|nr:glycosyltransferase family 4 protein [Capsulimonadales bacterium]
MAVSAPPVAPAVETEISSDASSSVSPYPLGRLPRTSAHPPCLLYVSTLDRIISVMLPHLTAARAAGWRVEVACQPTVYREELARYADAVHEVPMRRFPLHPSNLTALRRLVALIRRGGYTVVHCHNPTGGFVGRLAATLARTSARRVYTAHGFHFHRHGNPLSNTIYRAAERLAGHHWSDAVLTITDEDYQAALTARVVPSDRLFLTGGVGVSVHEDFNPALVSAGEIARFRDEIGASPQTRVITMVGELIPRKRPQDALAIFARVRERFPDSLLVLVGDGAMSDRLRSEARTRRIEEHVRFLGFRRDVRIILASSQIFLFPSKQEGLPCAIQEALAMCLPVVATDVRGCRDLVDASCGRLAPLGDIAGLAEGVCDILSLSLEQQRRMGAVGRRKMLHNFERLRCVLHWQEIYCQLLADTAPEN